MYIIFTYIGVVSGVNVLAIRGVVGRVPFSADISGATALDRLLLA